MNLESYQEKQQLAISYIYVYIYTYVCIYMYMYIFVCSFFKTPLPSELFSIGYYSSPFNALLWLNIMVCFAPTCYSVSSRKAEKSKLLVEL